MISAASRRRALPSRLIPASFPAPAGGLNTVQPASTIPITDSMVQWNLIAGEYGLRVRLGYQEWVTGITGAADNQVRSVLPFTGSQNSNDKLFVTTSSGIWDCTTSTDTPTLSIAFADTSGDAGHGVSVVKVTLAGHFLVYTDEVNGLYVYTEGGAWAKIAAGVGATQINNVDPATFCFVCEHKNRLWFLVKDTAEAWYMASGALYGDAEQFDIALGAKFRAGGDLVGMWSWTMDGGAGIDDSLVAVSRGGDVMVYQGSDPVSAATWGLQGVWFAGAVPAGRQIATNFGGDMLLLSKTGILPLSKLISGGMAGVPTQYETAKIGNLFNSLALQTSSLKGWSMRLHPEDNALIVTVPTTSGEATNQLAMSLWNKSWSRYRDLPIYSSETWGGKFYFGTTDGRVCINEGYIDNVLLADPNSYDDIEWSVITSFQNFGNGRQKQVQLIRPTILCDGGTPIYGVEARYRYDFTEVGTPSAGSVGGNVWDSGLWDTATWSGEYGATQVASGGAGMGSEFAVAAKGSARARTVLVSFDVEYTTGGFL